MKKFLYYKFKVTPKELATVLLISVLCAAVLTCLELLLS